MGDFRGLTKKLDYLQDLGITAIWLLPFFPSPWRDDGYDISDYNDVHPSYGTLRDFQNFLKQAHRRGIRVLTEVVLNHTSDQHPWFQRSRRAAPGTRWRDFYVWSDTAEKYQDARIIFKDFETSNWAWDPVAKAYYWHRFYSHQPDLNFDNPHVQEAVLEVIDFWFDLGVDGFRLDAVPYLYEREGTNCENLPETHAFLQTAPRPRRFEIPRPHSARRSQPVARGCGRLFCRRRRMPDGISLSPHAAPLHGHSHGGSLPDHGDPAGDAGHPSQLPMGAVPAQSR